MKELVSFDEWIIDTDAPFGSGASKKHWLINNNNSLRGIFKYPKITHDGNITGEYWAECLAYDIAQTLGIACAKVDIGTYQGDKGSMSYMLLEKDEALVEGISFLNIKYPLYNPDEFFDAESETWYSIQMIINSISGIGLEKDFLMIPIYDALIGNTDRHHSNWGIVSSTEAKKMKISPLYDNGSSLCSVVNEGKINFNDKRWLQGLINTRSKSLIRFEKTKTRPTHFQMIEFIAEHYCCDCIEYIKSIQDNLTDKKIAELISNYPDDIISPIMKKLLSLFLKERRNRIIEIFMIGM